MIMRNARVIAEVARDDFLWDIYSRPGGVFEQSPVESDALLRAAKILTDEGCFEALTRLRHHFRDAFVVERDELHDIIGYDE
jgi:hypothetical protein